MQIRKRGQQIISALHSYNATPDTHFVLAADWEALLRQQFQTTWQPSAYLWLLAKVGARAAGLLIAATHVDSPLFRYRRWVEVQALYVEPAYRDKEIAHQLLNRA